MTYRIAQHIVELSFNEYSKIRAEYWRSVNTNVIGYLADTTHDDDWFKGMMRTAIEVSFLQAAAVAWLDADENTSIGPDALAFVVAYKVAEFGFVESLLLSLRARKFAPEEELLDDIGMMEMGRLRADGYAQGLDILYNHVKVRGAGEKLLLFGGDDGFESCFDCQKYKGQRHPASWWVRHDAIPPNRNFECKGYHCFHILLDEKLHIFTL